MSLMNQQYHSSLGIFLPMPHVNSLATIVRKTTLRLQVWISGPYLSDDNTFLLHAAYTGYDELAKSYTLDVPQTPVSWWKQMKMVHFEGVKIDERGCKELSLSMDSRYNVEVDQLIRVFHEIALAQLPNLKLLWTPSSNDPFIYSLLRECLDTGITFTNISFPCAVFEPSQVSLQLNEGEQTHFIEAQQAFSKLLRSRKLENVELLRTWSHDDLILMLEMLRTNPVKHLYIHNCIGINLEIVRDLLNMWHETGFTFCIGISSLCNFATLFAEKLLPHGCIGFGFLPATNAPGVDFFITSLNYQNK
ncbi:hypothetical protein L596_001551 [Steinernema carpocapsae]|uniref:Uncharacterized protein n=1 Tax=Steinernema carpocapsae TaxID=34508 RepID=A0A4U8ULD6_STECR|nr:hypothetical protein L596_001551 [Steinernema carpocapsae]